MAPCFAPYQQPHDYEKNHSSLLHISYSCRCSLLSHEDAHEAIGCSATRGGVAASGMMGITRIIVFFVMSVLLLIILVGCNQWSIVRDFCFTFFTLIHHTSLIANTFFLINSIDQIIQSLTLLFWFLKRNYTIKMIQRKFFSRKNADCLNFLHYCV